MLEVSFDVSVLVWVLSMCEAIDVDMINLNFWSKCGLRFTILCESLKIPVSGSSSTVDLLCPANQGVL